MSLSGEVRSWNWECFHRMKKNEIKTGRNKPPEVRTREQIEDRAFNRMLLWLATAAVVEDSDGISSIASMFTPVSVNWGLKCRCTRC